jgi:cytochrome c oxidase subunit 3
MSSNVSKAPYYFVPAPTRHPIVTSIGLAAFGFGMSKWVNGSTFGMILALAGIVWTIVSLYKWFGDAIHESESGLNSVNVDISYRWSMAWFIFSEIMCTKHCDALVR